MLIVWFIIYFDKFVTFNPNVHETANLVNLVGSSKTKTTKN